METKILSTLKREPKSNAELRRSLGLSTASYDAKLDRTLQKLRRAGKLRLVGSRWTVESFDLCQHCKGKGYVAQ